MNKVPEAKMDESKFEDMRVIDIVPYRYGILCSIGDGEPFINDIVDRQWSDDGELLILGLESHNAICHSPNEILSVIKLDVDESAGWFQDTIKRDKQRIANRPVPSRLCKSCRQPLK